MLWGTAGRSSSDTGACFKDSILHICSSVFGKERFLVPGAGAGVVPLSLGMSGCSGAGLSPNDALKPSREKSSTFKVTQQHR